MPSEEELVAMFPTEQPVERAPEESVDTRGLHRTGVLSDCVEGWLLAARVIAPPVGP
jgi:hypothetical protein